MFVSALILFEYDIHKVHVFCTVGFGKKYCKHKMFKWNEATFSGYLT